MPALKSAKSFCWFVRIDGEEEVLRPKVLQFASCVDVVDMLCCAHMGAKHENPHVHYVITLNHEIQKQSFAVRVKHFFQVVDRGYALDTWDAKRAEYGAVSYLFHEPGAKILVKKGWSDSEISEAQRVATVANEAITESKEKASTKLIEKAIKHFEGKHPSKYEILQFMIYKIYERENYHPGNFKLKQYVEEVEIKLTDNIKLLIGNIYNDLWRP